MNKAPCVETEIKKERDRANEGFAKKLIEEIQAGKDLGELLAEDYKDIGVIQEQDAAQLSEIRIVDPRDAHIEALVSLLEDIGEYADNPDGNRLIPGDTARAIDQFISNRQDLRKIAHDWRLTRRHMLDQAINLLYLLWLEKKIYPGSPVGKKVYELLDLAGFMDRDKHECKQASGECKCGDEHSECVREPAETPVPVEEIPGIPKCATDGRCTKPFEPSCVGIPSTCIWYKPADQTIETMVQKAANDANAVIDELHVQIAKPYPHPGETPESCIECPGTCSPCIFS